MKNQAHIQQQENRDLVQNFLYTLFFTLFDTLTWKYVSKNNGHMLFKSNINVQDKEWVFTYICAMHLNFYTCLNKLAFQYDKYIANIETKVSNTEAWIHISTNESYLDTTPYKDIFDAIYDKKWDEAIHLVEQIEEQCSKESCVKLYPTLLRLHNDVTTIRNFFRKKSNRKLI